MIKKSNIREIIRKEIIRATVRIYGDRNIERWGTSKVYGEQIQSIWKLAYKELADRYPKREWLQTLIKTPSKDVELKLVLRIPNRDIEIDLPDKDRKFGAIAHAGGTEMLLELLGIIQNLKNTCKEDTI